MPLLTFTSKGIYCPEADVFIDPWSPVRKALITHGHSDHARSGHKEYLCTDSAKPVLKLRLGQQIQIQSVPYGKSVKINGVNFSFHPAGHIVGSAQIRIEYKGEIWVVSGDYKVENDGVAEAFEVVPCHTFITESTFGLPVYKWEAQEDVFEQIHSWWQQNKELGKVSLLAGYSLGKAQRLLGNLDPGIGPIFTHGAVENVNEVLRNQGVKLPPTQRVLATMSKEIYRGGLVIAPPSAISSSWSRKFKPLSTGIASGWMALRGARRRRAVDRGFILSDHADWIQLNQVIKETGAKQIFVTHGYTDVFSKWLNEQGWDAKVVPTRFEGELAEIGESTTEVE
ncbi:MAG: ligase-associated DNA damage response exonuclease [Bacteroidota bacterium]